MLVSVDFSVPGAGPVSQDVVRDATKSARGGRCPWLLDARVARRLLVAGVDPAGTGKTTAMQLTAAALDTDGRALVAVAPSARAAAVLGAEIGVTATTIAKSCTPTTRQPPAARRFRPPGPCVPAT